MIRVLSNRIFTLTNAVAKKQQLIIRGLGTNKETYSERQEKKGRPVSPHVTIYAFPIAGISSITNRITGIMLWVGLTSIGTLHLVSYDVHSLMTIIGTMPFFGTVGKVGVAFPLVYHYLGGVRHLLWDRDPDLLESDKVELASKALLGSSLILSLGIAFM